MKMPGEYFNREWREKPMRMMLMIVSAILLPLNVNAQMVEDGFTILDANRDGAVSVQEAQVDDSVAERFSESDTNSSGFLSREEFAAAFADSETEPESHVD